MCVCVSVCPHFMLEVPHFSCMSETATFYVHEFMYAPGVRTAQRARKFVCTRARTRRIMRGETESAESEGGRGERARVLDVAVIVLCVGVCEYILISIHLYIHTHTV